MVVPPPPLPVPDSARGYATATGPDSGPAGAIPVPTPGRGAGAGGGINGGSGTGAGSAGAAQGLSGSRNGPGEACFGDEYLEGLDAHFQRAKRNASFGSRLRDETGTALIALDIARDGRILKAELAKSSGYPAIDQAVLETVRRASPVPALPASFSKEICGLVLPVRYR